MLVYHSDTPEALRRLNKWHVSVYWKLHREAWVTQELFLVWYINCVRNLVQNLCKEIYLPPKAILVLADVLGNPTHLDEVQTKLKFNILYMPPNITSFHQPMQLGDIASAKAYYLQESFSKMVKGLDTNPDITFKDQWNF